MKFLVLLCVGLSVLLGAAIIAPSFIDWNKYKEQVTQKVELATGLNVEIAGDVSLGLLPSPRIYVEGVRVADPVNVKEALLLVELLDVRLELMPLLQGAVKVNKVVLDEPVIRLARDKNGRFNYMTSQIETMQGLSDARKDEAKASDLPISFDAIEISNGSFLYLDGKTVFEVSSVNFASQADSLSGPFKGQGQFKVSDKNIGLDFKTGVIDASNMSSSLSLRAKIDGVDVSYAGVASGGDNASTQGELTVKASDLSRLVSGATFDGDLALSGLLTADVKSVALKDASFSVGEHSLNGGLDVDLAPLRVKGAFKAQNAFNVDQFMGSKKRGNGQSSPLDVVDLLPKVIELPKLGGVDLSLSLPNVVYNAQNYKGVQIDVGDTRNGFNVGVSVENVPGDATIQAGASLVFAEVSYSSAANMNIYSGPSLDISVRGQSGDVGKTVYALSGMNDVPLISSSKKGVFDFDATVSSVGLFLNKGVLNLDKDAYAVTGSLKAQGGQKPNLLNVKLVADVIDVASFSGASSGAHKGQVSRKMTLPFSVNFDAVVHKVITGDHTVRGLSLGASVIDDVVTVKSFRADDFAGQAINMDGAVTIDMNGSRPYLKGDVQLGDFKFKSQAQKQKKTNTERWSSAPISSDWLNSMDADLDVRAKSIVFDQWNLSKPNLSLSLKDEVLKLNKLEAGLYDGSINVSGTTQKGAQGQGLALSHNISVDGVNMQPLIRSLVGVPLIKGRGEIGASTKIDAQGGSVKALIGSLAGQGRVMGSDIVIDGLDINRFARALSEDAKPGDTVLNLWKGASNGGSSSFETLDGSFKVNQGVIDLEKLLLDGPRASINTTGRVDVPQWTVQMAHLMTVKDRDDVPPFTVNISGSLDNPGQTFAKGALNDFLSRKIQRKLDKVLGGQLGEKLDSKLGLDGMLKGVLGGAQSNSRSQKQVPVNDNSVQPQEQPPANQDVRPEDVVEDLLKGFLR